MTQYGQVRVDFITYTTGVAPNEANVTANVSGLFNSPTFSGNVLIKSDLNVDNEINTNTIDVTSNAVIGGDLTVSGNINGSGVNVSGFTGLFASGSETSPSISFIDNEDTGIYSFGPGHIGITNSGIGSVFIDSSGKVGIGVSNPSAYFQIQQAKFEITGLTAEREYIFPDETGTIALTSSNVASASQWQTARTITITGDASGNVSLDGSQNVSFNLDVARATNADNATTFSGLETSDFLRAGQNVVTSGDMTANSFVGDGAGISNINAQAIAFGIISGERLPAMQALQLTQQILLMQ
jgi:cytoskeletal protein CcmA (bactofilin family)